MWKRRYISSEFCNIYSYHGCGNFWLLYKEIGIKDNVAAELLSEGIAHRLQLLIPLHQRLELVDVLSVLCNLGLHELELCFDVIFSEVEHQMHGLVPKVVGLVFHPLL